jgi:hypothetical protein
VPRANRNQPARTAIIPLVPVSLPGSSSLPEGSIEPGRLSPPIWPCTTRGFPCPRCRHRSGGLLPHLFTLAKRREHFVGVSQVSLCDATALHSAGGLILCGTFRSSAALRPDQVATPRAEARNSALRQTLRGKPPGVTRRVALSRVPLTIPQPPFGVCALINVPQDGVRTFLPPSHLPMTKPAITRPARHLDYIASLGCNETNLLCVTGHIHNTSPVHHIWGNVHVAAFGVKLSLYHTAVATRRLRVNSIDLGPFVTISYAWDMFLGRLERRCAPGPLLSQPELPWASRCHCN